MLEIKVPSFVLENPVEEVQICFTLPGVRSHAWFIRQHEAYSVGQLRIGVEQFSENVPRSLALIEPLVVHPWFEDGARQCTLLLYVDDATSRLMHLHFTATESTFSLFILLFEKSRAHDKKRIKTLSGGFIKNKFHSVLAARKISSNL